MAGHPGSPSGSCRSSAPSCRATAALAVDSFGAGDRFVTASVREIRAVAPQRWVQIFADDGLADGRHRRWRRRLTNPQIELYKISRMHELNPGLPTISGGEWWPQELLWRHAGERRSAVSADCKSDLL